MPRPGEHKGWTRADTANAAGLAVLSVVLAVMRWKKMGSLMWLDPAHWLNEISRVARGEVPYRDFSFQYPPLTVYLYGWLLRVFGVNFTAVQVITDVIDGAVIVCCYALIRRLLPRGLHLAVAGMLVAVCATSKMNFNLFSFETYSPALQTGALGVMLLLFGLRRLIREGRIRGGRIRAAEWALAAGGGFIAILSKPESALAAVTLLGLAGLLAENLRLSLGVAAAAVLPAGAAYVWVAKVAGGANLLAGISGYGLATAFCPWWPTGVGVFGMLAYLGAAAAIAGLVSLPRRRSFAAEYGRKYSGLLAAGIGGAAVYAGYVFYQSRDALTDRGLAWGERLKRVLLFVGYSSPMLEPVLWVTLIVFGVVGWRVARRPALQVVRQRESGESRDWLLLLTAPAAMCVRSLFGSTQSSYPEVAAICYPFLLILGPYYLWRFLAPAGMRYRNVLIAVLAGGYGIVRVAGGWPEMLSDRNYGTLHTEAGTVKVRSYEADSKVYAYVMRNTSPGDYVLDLPYGGGMNFASGRRSPIFNTQLWGMGVPQAYEALDLSLLLERQPKVVIGLEEVNLGTYWGFGQRGNRACPCPRLVWMPDGKSWEPDRVLAVAAYLNEHFQVREKIQGRVVLGPR